MSSAASIVKSSAIHRSMSAREISSLSQSTSSAFRSLEAIWMVRTGPPGTQSVPLSSTSARARPASARRSPHDCASM